MNLKQLKLRLLVFISIPFTALAEVSMELEEACYGDFDLGEHVAQIVDSGASDLDAVSQEEADQIAALLQTESIQELSNNEKANAVLRACAEGKIFQARHSHIINKNQ